MDIEREFVSLVLKLLQQNEQFRCEVTAYLQNLSQVERNDIHPGLLGVAMSYDSTKVFCRTELSLELRIANALFRAGYTPVQVVTSDYQTLLMVRNLGVIGAQRVIDARQNWISQNSSDL